jgi:hypothetical protein
MIASLDFKNISSKNLKDYTQYSSFGLVGAVFFSHSFKYLDYSLLNFLYESGNHVDSLFILAHKDILTDEDIKILALLPYVTLIYTDENLDNFFKYVKCDHFFETAGHPLPDSLQENLKSLENCKIHTL